MSSMLVQEREMGAEGLKDQGNLSRPPRRSLAAQKTFQVQSMLSYCEEWLHFHCGIEKHIIKKQGQEGHSLCAGQDSGCICSKALNRSVQTSTETIISWGQRGRVAGRLQLCARSCYPSEMLIMAQMPRHPVVPTCAGRQQAGRVSWS